MKADARGGDYSGHGPCPRTPPVTQPGPNTLSAGTQGGLHMLIGAEHLQLPLALGYQVAR